MSAPSSKGTGRLTFFYVASLSAIATLSVLGQLLVQRSLDQQTQALEVVNQAQIQQTAVPQMSRIILTLDTTTDTTERQAYIEQLKTLISEAEAWQNTLPMLVSDPSMSKARQQEVQQALAKLLPTHKQILEIAEAKLTSKPSNQSPPPVLPNMRINSLQLLAQAPPGERPLGQRMPQGGPPGQMPPQGAPAGQLPQGAPAGQPPQGPPADQPPQGEPPAGQPPQGAPPAGQPPQGAPPAAGQPPQGAPSGQPPQGAPSGQPPQGAPSARPPQGEPPAGQRLLEGRPTDIPSVLGQLRPRPQLPASAPYILLLERNFMQEVDQLLLTYNEQTVATVKHLKKIEFGLLIVTLGVLVLEGLLVFRPAVNKIDETMAALSESLRKTQQMANTISHEKKKSEKLLLNILPQPIAHRLKQNQEAIADGFNEVTVLFADIVGFTQLSTRVAPQQLVALLNHIFSTFDQLAEKHGLEKIKTIGDAYMAVGGLPEPRADHAEATVAMALEMQAAMTQFNQETGNNCAIRIGINTGPVVAGVIGIKKFIYDLWGDTVNIASRMESHGKPGTIQITDSTYQHIKDKFVTEARGNIIIKGKGEMKTYWVKGLQEAKNYHKETPKPTKTPLPPAERETIKR
jgi:class 3 adenylate cyclase